MAIAAALTLNHATDLFANTLVMHCLSLMHSHGNNVIYDAARVCDRAKNKKKIKKREEKTRAGRGGESSLVRASRVNKARARSIIVSYKFAITALKRSRAPPRHANSDLSAAYR